MYKGSGIGNKIHALRRLGKTYKQIQEELSCPHSTVAYHAVKLGLGSKNNHSKPSFETILEMQLEYDLCGSSVKVAKRFGYSQSTVLKWVKTKESKFKTLEEKRVQLTKSVQARRKKLKQLLVDYKGGKCQRCTYNKCIGALEFHHREPSQKVFNIGHGTYSLEKLKVEADKCDLVCSNCHRELEYNK